MRQAHTNPFRADRVGALPLIDHDVAALARTFAALGHRAAITGRHGAGKSTLQRAIGDALRASGERSTHVTLPASAILSQRIAATCHAIAARDTVVLIDGFEQLSRWQCWRIRRRCPRLLVTAHGPVGLPVLVTLRPTLATLDCLLDCLLPAVPPAVQTAAQIAFVRCGGDVRRTFLTLYDVWAESGDF